MNSPVLEEMLKNEKSVKSAHNPDLSVLVADAESSAPKLPGRYLQAVALSFDNGADMWHLMTTMPKEFDKKCAELRAFIAAFAAKYKHPKRLPQDYATLADDIYASIFGHSNGVYYLVTRNYLDSADVFAPHMAQTIIKEAIDKVAIRDANHQGKAREMCSMLERLVTRIDALMKLVPSANVILRNNLNDFAEYLELQEECLNAALEYDGLDVESTAQKKIRISKELRLWHPEPALPLTPTKPGSAHKRTLEQYQQYQVTSSEKSPKKMHRTKDTPVSSDAEESEDCGYTFKSETNTPAGSPIKPSLASTLTPLFNATFSESATALTGAATTATVKDSPRAYKQLDFGM